MVDLRSLIPTRLPRTLLSALLVAVAAFLLQPTTSVYAGTLTVTTTIDELASPGTGCSLREAIMEANAAVPGTYPECGAATGGGSDIINLPAGTFSLTITATNEDNNLDGDLDINDDVMIVGAGPAATIISQTSIPVDRVFHILSGAVEFNNVTISDGIPPFGGFGGGIYNLSTADIIVRNCTISDNSAYTGGGVFTNTGTFTIIDSTFTGNGANTGGGFASGSAATTTITNSSFINNHASTGGAGIYNFGPVTISDSDISGNTSSSGSGGGIYSREALTITNTTITGNSADRSGAGIAQSEDVPCTITDSLISGNIAMDRGGGIFSYGAPSTIHWVDLNLINTIVENNTAANGGGIYSENTRLNINTSTIRNNTATRDLNDTDGGGGLYLLGGEGVIQDSLITNNHATNRSGGGLSFRDSDIWEIRIIRTTISNNTAQVYGGGLVNFDNLPYPQFGVYLEDSTVTGNSAGYGGGIAVYVDTADYASIFSENSTISGNTATIHGGGVYMNRTPSSLGGAITLDYTTVYNNNNDNIYQENVTSPVELSHTLVGNPASGSNCDGTAGAAITDSGDNLEEDPGEAYTCGGLTHETTDAMLGALANNGGPTDTHLSAPGSPAVNQIAVCVLTNDQRGIARPQGATCDIGSVEAHLPDIDVQRPVTNSIPDGGADALGLQSVGPFTLTYTIENTGPGPLTIPAGGVTAANLTNVSGFTVNTALPLTLTTGNTATLQIQFTIDAAGAFSFDLDIASDDPDENPYDIAVSGTGVVDLVASAACNGSDLDVTITVGDPNFDITGAGPGLPLSGVGIATHTLTGPGTWTGVTVTELTGDTESSNLGDFTCGPEIDVQRSVGTSITDGGNDAVGAQPIGPMTLTYTIDNTAGNDTLIIPAGGVTASNLTNVSGFTVNTALPLTVAAGLTATLQIEFNNDAVGAFSFDLDIDSNDADENPYDIAVLGTGTINLAAAAACNGDDLEVNITAGDNPFNITGTSGPDLPQNGVGMGITTLAGPDSWVGVTVTETAGDLESANLGNFTCPPPVVVGGEGGGGGATQVQAPGCNLTIDVEADREVVTPGDQVVWTVLIRNPGPADCHGVQTYGTMPGEFSITDITTTRGSIHWDSGQYYLVELGTILANDQAAVTLDSLLQGGAAFALPEGTAAQSAGQQICLTGYITEPVNDTDCVTLFPDTLPATGGEPVKHIPSWVWVAAAGLLIIGIGAYAIKRQRTGETT